MNDVEISLSCEVARQFSQHSIDANFALLSRRLEGRVSRA